MTHEDTYASLHFFSMLVYNLKVASATEMNIDSVTRKGEIPVRVKVEFALILNSRCVAASRRHFGSWRVAGVEQNRRRLCVDVSPYRLRCRYCRHRIGVDVGIVSVIVVMVIVIVIFNVIVIVNVVFLFLLLRRRRRPRIWSFVDVSM